MSETKAVVSPAKLSLVYSEENVPKLIAHGGNAIPTTLQVVDETGVVLAEYTAPWRQPWMPMYLEWDLR